MTRRGPYLQRPIYLSGAQPPPAVVEKVRTAAKSPGLITATAVGVTAAYFAPKLFDYLLGLWRERQAAEEVADLEYEEDAP